MLETHGKEHGTGEKLARIVRKIGSARVKLNYDTANVIFYGGVNPVQDLKTCLAETAYIHIKDKGGRDDVWDFPALGKGLALRGYTLFEIVSDPERFARGKAFVLDGLATGALKPIIARTFPLEQIVEAHRYMEAGEQFGKIVVTVEG